MYDITDKLIHVNQYTRCGRKLKNISAIVIHWTGLAGGNNNGLFNWFDKVSVDSKRYGSTHYGIDNDSIYRFIPDDEVAYHVGATKNYTTFAKRKFCDQYPNDYTLGIELNPEYPDGEFNEDVLDQAIWLCVQLCRKYSLSPMCDIIRHFDVTGKDCPKWYVTNPSFFGLFKDHVEGRL